MQNHNMSFPPGGFNFRVAAQKIAFGFLISGDLSNDVDQSFLLNSRDPRHKGAVLVYQAVRKSFQFLPDGFLEYNGLQADEHGTTHCTFDRRFPERALAFARILFEDAIVYLNHLDTDLMDFGLLRYFAENVLRGEYHWLSSQADPYAALPKVVGIPFPFTIEIDFGYHLVSIRPRNSSDCGNSVNVIFCNFGNRILFGDDEY